MSKEEWIAYIIYEKLSFIFNREGRVYTGDLCRKRKIKKLGPL
jgi:hypothetical protein